MFAQKNSLSSKLNAQLSLFLSTLVCILAFLAPTGSQAKELTNRLGVGVKDNTAVSIPSLAVVYYPGPDYGVTGGLGVDTQKDQSKFTANVGVRRIIFREQNMNFYFGGQFGLLNYEASGEKQSGFEMDALFGGEFFLPGLENLSFSFEGGAGIASLKDVRFRTIANDPFKAGIIFYF